MELRDYVNIIVKRWPVAVVVALTGVLLAGAVSLAATPTYSARSQVYVSVQGSDSTTDLLQGSNFTVRQVKSYTELVSTPRVLDPVIEELGLADDAASLAERVGAESPLDTSLINVTATDESPRLAADVANAVAGSLADVVAELETPAAGGDSPVQISTVRTATVPQSPSSPNLRLNLALGLVVGLALGIGLAVLRELLDTRIRSAADVEAVASAPVLGIIGYEEDAPDHPLIVQESPQALRAEAFRRLRTNLQFLELDQRARTFVMTSALAGEGKTTTSINLAITLADAGQRVVLVDADLRRPSVAKYMGIEGSVGLTTVLIGRVALEDAVQPWGSGTLDVVAAGQVPPNPSELLGSEAMADLVERLGTDYDVVVIDSPPLLPVTDAAILARRSGGAILVTGAGTVHRQQVEGAVAALETVGARLLGVVANRVPLKGAGSGSYGYSYYEYTSRPVQPARRRAEPAHGSRRSLRRLLRTDRQAPPSSAPDGPAPADAAPAEMPAAERVPAGSSPFVPTTSFDEVVAPRTGR
ncbi:polysaccharide biosynthesis tyrosine autokinase [Cellulosimicrobium arenosum]|uniref:non-specific protein-tyrosine kinase n=1 Tax=Cellulosimicrobium arenosum TaxID=2708133 RepID=A0A927PDT8_9MICO|nr:polysaccharide biosynthesis tyrosine autokinase [Cellulosimicrobium arenosum]MBD8079771.1 polysaccharide biosynthesis tyrosine autokinase [Cellulosimicrobium arenosum]